MRKKAGLAPRFARERLRVIAFIALAFVPLVAVEVVVLQGQQEAARDTIANSRLALARSAAADGDGYIDGNMSTLRALAQTRAVRTADAQTVNAIFAPIIQGDPNWLTIALTAADGYNISSLTSAARSVNISDRDYFRSAIGGRNGISPVIVTRGGTRTKTIVLAVPVAFDDGTRGVLSGALKLDKVDEELRGVVPATSIELRVVDRNGQEFIGPGSEETNAPDVKGRPEVVAGLAGRAEAAVATDLAGREALIAFAPAPVAGWVVILSEPTIAAYAVPDELGRTAGILTLAGLVIALAIGWYLSGRLARSYMQVETERFRLNDALKHAPARVGLLRGKDLVYTMASPGQLEQLGLREEDVVGKPFRSLDPDPDHRTILERVYQTGEPFIAHEMATSVRLANGRLVEGWYDAAIVPTKDVTGTIDGVIYYASDVSDLVRGRKRLEELAAAVATERDELQQIMNELPDGVVVMRRNLTTTRNKTADELLGRPFSGDFAATQADHVPRRPDGRPYEVADFPIMRALLRGESVHGEEMLIHNAARGEELSVLVSAAPVRREGEIVAAVSVFQDITQIRAFERQRSEFFSMASHEIRTPVTAIQLQLDLIARQLAKGDASQVQELVGKAHHRTKALTALINDLLDTTRIDAGRFGLELQELDLVPLVQRAAGDYPTDAGHPIFVVAVSEPLPVLADSRRLVEVLENLVSNAVKYSPRGGTVTIEIGRDGDNAFVQVRDEGIGVPDDERSRIFDRFFRTTVARPYGGVGLGLYISKEIVERLGGELVLQSSGANGSVFRLTLPLARREAEVAAPLGVNVGELGNR